MSGNFDQVRSSAEELLGLRGQILGSRVLYRQEYPRDLLLGSITQAAYKS
jgi:hypothetical protein